MEWESGRNQVTCKGLPSPFFTRLLGGHPSGIIQGQKAQVAAFSGDSGSWSVHSCITHSTHISGDFLCVGKALWGWDTNE